MKTVCLTMFLLLCSNNVTISSSHDKNSCNKIEKNCELSNFNQFYTCFRNAVINNDTIELKKLIHFPLDVWGHEDLDPRIKIPVFDRALFDEAMSANTDLNPITNEPRSTLEFLLQVEDIQQYKNYNSNDVEQLIGDLVFTRINGEWKLSLIFCDTRGR